VPLDRPRAVADKLAASDFAAANCSSAALIPACDLLTDIAMSHADNSRLAARSSADAAAAEGSRLLHEEFEAYYAARERRRLTTEAWARRMAVRALEAQTQRSSR